MNDTGDDIRRWMFKYRSYTPIPFLLLMIFFARPTAFSMIIGFIVVLLGEGIRFWGVSIAGSETRTTGKVGGTFLITTGPFGYVRNPLYVGNILLYCGVGIMSNALFPWLPIAALVWFCVQYHLIVTQEEEYLAERFGSAYETYRSKVGRFIPRVNRFVSTSPPPKRGSLREGLASERRTLQAIALVSLVILVLFIVRRA